MANGEGITPMVEKTVDIEIMDDVEIGAPNTTGLNIEELMSEVEISDTDDGGVLVDFDPQEERMIDEGDFYRNLAEDMDEVVLGTLSNDLQGQYEGNKETRKEWMDTYSEGLKLLGFHYEERTQPFRGATGVTHPLLAEAATQFQAQAYNELLPPEGPVRTTIMGALTKEKEQQAQRVKQFMNYYLTDIMEEYTPEFDQMLFYLPLAGSTFKKVYYDAALERPVSTFVPAEHLVVPYETSNLETCPIITHVVPMSANDLRKQQLAGFYRDVELEPQQADDEKLRRFGRDREAEQDTSGCSVSSPGEQECSQSHADIDQIGSSSMGVAQDEAQREHHGKEEQEMKMSAQSCGDGAEHLA